MRQWRSRAFSMVLLAAACGDESPIVAPGIFHGLKRDVTGAAALDVEIRYGGGLTAADARALFERMEIVSVREAFKSIELPMIEVEAQVVWGAPTFHVLLHPLNDAARSERYAWRAPLATSKRRRVIAVK
jgi:hypothetical protein